MLYKMLENLGLAYATFAIFVILAWIALVIESCR